MARNGDIRCMLAQLAASIYSPKATHGPSTGRRGGKQGNERLAVPPVHPYPYAGINAICGHRGVWGCRDRESVQPLLWSARVKGGSAQWTSGGRKGNGGCRQVTVPSIAFFNLPPPSLSDSQPRGGHRGQCAPSNGRGHEDSHREGSIVPSRDSQSPAPNQGNEVPPISKGYKGDHNASPKPMHTLRYRIVPVCRQCQFHKLLVNWGKQSIFVPINICELV